MQARITQQDLNEACDNLSAIPFFPATARATVMMQLAAMMPHREALEWTVNAAVNAMRRWEGIVELRGLLCSRYNAADGIDEWSSLPGHTAEEAEARHLVEHSQRNRGLLAPESREMLRQLTAKK